MENKFKNANEAFKYYKQQIPEYGIEFDDTQALFNVGFYLENPMDNLIEDQDRNWKWDYAEAEWQWYLSGDNNISKLGVTMRSNDLWYGFCNDQYCFSKLQELVATEVGLLVGSYYHFAHNLHLYDNIIEKL